MKNQGFFIHSVIRFIYSIIGEKFTLSWSTYHTTFWYQVVKLKLYYVAEVVGARELAEFGLIYLNFIIFILKLMS